MRDSSARRCDAKHIYKWSKHLMLGAFLDIETLKKCMALWGEAHFEVKCAKYISSEIVLAVTMLKKCTPAVAPSTSSSEKCRKLSDSEHFWTFRHIVS